MLTCRATHFKYVSSISNNHVLSELVNLHAPETEKKITLRPHAPWFSDSLCDAKCEKWRFERRWVKSRLEVDKQEHAKQCKAYHRMLEDAKTEYHKYEIANCNTKQLLQTINKICGLIPDTVQPSGDEQVVANSLGDYFIGKITKLKSQLDTPSSVSLPNAADPPCTSSLDNFQELSQDDIRKLMNNMPKNCSLDPLPTWLMKKCIDGLLPLTRGLSTTLSSRDMFRSAWRWHAFLLLSKRLMQIRRSFQTTDLSPICFLCPNCSNVQSQISSNLTWLTTAFMLHASCLTDQITALKPCSYVFTMTYFG